MRRLLLATGVLLAGGEAGCWALWPGQSGPALGCALAGALGFCLVAVGWALRNTPPP